jgi:DNA-binding transcriptional ArsR family regulator
MQPSRFKILQLLRKSAKPLFVDQIAEALQIHPRMLSHHLENFREQGLIASKYELVNIEGSRRTVAVRLCVATPKAAEVFRQIRERSK